MSNCPLKQIANLGSARLPVARLELLRRAVRARSRAGSPSEAFGILHGIRHVAHLIEKVVCPQQRQVHGDARAGSALLRLHHRARAGANLVGDLLLEPHGQQPGLRRPRSVSRRRVYTNWTLPSDRAQAPSCVRRCS
jgi:hypothetical protein